VVIRRFGPGVRRASNPDLPGTEGVAFWRDDERGVLLSEVYLRAGARIPAHANLNHCVFWVVEGSGHVQVGEERAPVGAGDAVHWPPGVDHSAWTESSPMRAFILEYGAARAQERDLAD
jgi:quercetin dioxygenase-like cupin family protein